MTDQLSTLRLERRDDGIAVLTLHRPDRLNAMTAAMFVELEQVLADLHADDGIRVLIVTGAGQAFCAGYDLDDAGELDQLSPLEMLDRQESAARVTLAVRNLPCPVLAAVNGPAAGGGFALALAADLRIAAPTARFGCAFVRIGLSSGDMGTSWLLPRVIDPGVAADMAYTGRLVDAEEAARIRLVNRVVEADELLPHALELASQIAANAPGAIRLSKRALQANQEVSTYAAARELESRGQTLLAGSKDVIEAIASAREGRAPIFTDA